MQLCSFAGRKQAAVQLQRVEFKSSSNKPCRLKPMEKIHLEMQKKQLQRCQGAKCNSSPQCRGLETASRAEG